MNVEDRIQALEQEIETRYDELGALRGRQEPVRWTKTYELLDGRGKPVDLKDLFGTHDRLILVYNMGRQCPWCTTWADGFSDSYHRIAEKMAFGVVSAETPEIQQQNRKERNCTFPWCRQRTVRFCRTWAL